MNKKIFLQSIPLILIITIGFAIINTSQNIQKNSITNINTDSEKRISNLENQLRCPSCDGITLKLCELPICREMKKSINEQVQSGKQDDAIINFFKTRYGNEILNETNKMIYFVFGFTCLFFTTVSIFILNKFKLRNQEK